MIFTAKRSNSTVMMTVFCSVAIQNAYKLQMKKSRPETCKSEQQVEATDPCLTVSDKWLCVF